MGSFDLAERIVDYIEENKDSKTKAELIIEINAIIINSSY